MSMTDVDFLMLTNRVYDAEQVNSQAAAAACADVVVKIAEMAATTDDATIRSAAAEARKALKKQYDTESDEYKRRSSYVSVASTIAFAAKRSSECLTEFASGSVGFFSARNRATQALKALGLNGQGMPEKSDKEREITRLVREEAATRKAVGAGVKEFINRHGRKPNEQEMQEIEEDAVSALTAKNADKGIKQATERAEALVAKYGLRDAVMIADVIFKMADKAISAEREVRAA